MEKNIKIDNMTCEHCSAKVESALKSLDGVEDVKVSLFRKKATVNGDHLDDNLLKEAIVNAGFDVISID